MRHIANKWWFAVLSLLVFLIGDLATNIVQFAGTLSDDATYQSISFKHWVTFWGTSTMSLTMCFKTFTSSAWQRASGRMKPEHPLVTVERTEVSVSNAEKT